MSASTASRRAGSRHAPDRHPLPSAERVYAAVREEIVSGRLSEGERLVETEIAGRLGVSRTPVREALARLQVDRLVSGTLQGPIVRPVTLREIEETYELREVLEGLAARLAAGLATAWDVARMNGFLEHMETYRRQEDWQAWAEANWRFHDAIFQASGNGRLRLENRGLVDLVRRFFRISAASDAMAERALREHREIVDAIASRDADAADERAMRHVRQAGIETLRQMRTERTVDSPAGPAERPPVEPVSRG